MASVFARLRVCAFAAQALPLCGAAPALLLRRLVSLVVFALSRLRNSASRRGRCPCAGRHLLCFCSGWVLWLFLRLPGSALAPRGAGVAPVRGGTYFLCRRKESRQRKR